MGNDLNRQLTKKDKQMANKRYKETVKIVCHYEIENLNKKEPTLAKWTKKKSVSMVIEMDKELITPGTQARCMPV